MQQRDDDVTQSSPTSSSTIVRHYCFLVHGFMGDDSEMAYVGTALNKKYNNNKSQTTETAVQNPPNNNQTVEVVVHRTLCNNGKTYDGIAKGGARLAREVMDYVKSGITGNDEGNTQVVPTISFVGNSLGGLYARYAIGIMQSEPHGDLPWNFNVFSTTATPHLGCSSHTYLTLPRLLERGVSRAILDTGRDLFRNNDGEDLISSMALDHRYLKPLSMFRRRIAYANAFMTDFQVPTATAAFLCDQSASIHKYTTDSIHKDNNANDKKFIVATFETEKQGLPPQPEGYSNKSNIISNNKIKSDDYVQLSESLDRLGWRKVFVDVRHLIPFPKISLMYRDRQSSRKLLETKLSSNQTNFASKDLVSLLCSASPDGIPLIPFGHTVMVANAKNALYRRMNSGGKVVMDHFAEELLEEMLKWE